MPARAATTRGRGHRGGGALQWIALLTAATIIMGLTFTLGILVGRQWSRPASVTAAAEMAPGRRCRSASAPAVFIPPPTES